MNNLTPSTITFQVIDQARQFLKQNRHNPALEETFGYFINNPIAARLNQTRLLNIIKRVHQHQTQRPQPLKIVDLACGGGLIATSLSQIGCQVLGIDHNQAEIEIAQNFTQLFPHPAQFIAADLTNPDWQIQTEKILGGKPNIAILAYALHHIPRVDQFVQNLCGWLPAGSTIIINEENDRSWLRNLKQFFRTIIIRNTDDEHHRPIAQWQQLFIDNQAPIKFTEGIDYLPSPPTTAWSVIFEAVTQ